MTGTTTVPLERIAFGRSGDKGDSSNVGLIARSDAAYLWMRDHITPRWAKLFAGALVKGEVERFDVPNLRALNFILHDSLGGGGSASLLTDAQGKTHAQALLRCQVDVPDSVLSATPESSPPG